MRWYFTWLFILHFTFSVGIFLNKQLFIYNYTVYSTAITLLITLQTVTTIILHYSTILKQIGKKRLVYLKSYQKKKKETPKSREKGWDFCGNTTKPQPGENSNFLKINKTYHHAIDCFHNFLHFISCDESIFIKVIKTKCPWKRTNSTMKCILPIWFKGNN